MPLVEFLRFRQVTIHPEFLTVSYLKVIFFNVHIDLLLIKIQQYVRIGKLGMYYLQLHKI